MTTDERGSWSYRPALDGLRTVAIYLVVLFHAGLAHVSNGYLGVDVFFVLSGFLVTSIILKEHDETGGLRLRRFYARRIRRLLPAAVVLVASVCVLSTFVLPRLTRLTLVSDARSALLYIANWHFLGGATNYFAADVDKSPFLHFWSLAIEEQFYFVFPVLLLGLLWVARRWRWPGAVATGLWLVLVVSLAIQIVVADRNPLRAYYATDARLYQLLAGGLLAAVRHHLVVPSRFHRVVGAGAGVGVLTVVLLSTDLVDMSVSTRGIVATVVTIGVVAAVEVAPRSLTGALLSRRPMTYLGRISYGTYLWHWPIIVLVGAAVDVEPVTMAVIACLGATAIAAASFRFIESPIRRAPALDRRPRAVIVTGLACSLAIALVVVQPVLRSVRRPSWVSRGPSISVDTANLGAGVDAATLEAALGVAAPATLDLAATEPPKFDQTACRPEDLAACVLHQGSGNGMHLHLVGDSNAMVMIPLFVHLAEQYDFTLSVTARVGCPWQQGLRWQAQDDALVDHCVSARDEWYSTIIPALQPDVIVAVNVPRDRGSRPDAFFVPDVSVEDATAHSLDAFSAMGARTVLYEPLPYDDHDPTTCLSGARTVGDCAYEANTTPFPTETVYRAADATRDDVWSLDADPLACPYLPACVPMIDSELVFRNQFHLSNEWVLDHADQWWAQLVDSGALAGWFDAAGEDAAG